MQRSTARHAGLLDFLKAAFDAEELGRVVGEDGKIGHAEVRIGDAVVMAFDSPDGLPEYVEAMNYVQGAKP